MATAYEPAVRSKGTALRRVGARHDDIIDIMLEFPQMKGYELAERIGMSQAWLSQVINSDAFRERYAQRKGELVDPQLMTRIEDRINALTAASLDELQERLERKQLEDGDVIKTLAVLTKAAGYGARTNVTVDQSENRYVVLMPHTGHEDDSSWQDMYRKEMTVAPRAEY